MPAKKPAKAAKLPAKKFNCIVILDTRSQFTAAEAELRLRTMAKYHTRHHTRGEPLPPVVRVSALDMSPMASAMTLYRAWRAVGHGSPALYLCASTTGNAALSMLTTDWGNVVVGPNDGTLSLLARLFAERHIPFTLEPLDLDSIVALERVRMDNPDWEAAPDFALRDYLSPAAAMRVGGLSPTFKNTLPLSPATLPFAEGSRTLNLKLHETQPAYALPTGKGHYLLNLTLDPLSFDQLLDDQAAFTLNMTGVKAPCPLLGAFRLPTIVAQAPTPTSLGGGLGQRRAGTLGLDGTLAPAWDERFLTLTLAVPAPPQAREPLPLALTRQS